MHFVSTFLHFQVQDHNSLNIPSAGSYPQSISDTTVDELFKKALDANGSPVWYTDFAANDGVFLTRSIRLIRKLKLDNIGVVITGICKNGIEAYDMILDSYPDIVLTDIKMPGLSGLKQIEKVALTDKQIEFVLLSGFGEFEQHLKEFLKAKQSEVSSRKYKEFIKKTIQYVNSHLADPSLSLKSIAVIARNISAKFSSGIQG